MDQIIPNLFISNDTNANNSELLLSNNIQCIASLNGCYQYLVEIPYKHILAITFRDSLDVNISSTIELLNNWIDERIQKGLNVLVFCGAGVSRSGSIIVGYLMHHLQLDYDTARIVTGKQIGRAHV